jgi:uncharacterized membrane protein
VVAVVAAAVARLSILLSRPLWHDELFTIWISRHPFPDLWDNLRRDSGPPLFYILEKPFVWLGDATNSDVLARVLPFAAAAAIFAFSMRARRKEGHGMFVALCASSPLLLVYSAEARAYALLAFLGFLLFRLLMTGPPTTSRLWTAAAVCAAALWIHYLAILLVAGCALMLLALRRLLPLLSLIGGSALFLPWIPILTNQPAKATGWMREPLLGAASGFLSVVGGAGRIPNPLGGPLPRGIFLSAQIVGAGLLVAVIMSSIRRHDSESAHAAVLSLVVMALIMAASLVRPVSFPGRSEMLILPIWLWAVARASVRGGLTRWLAIGAVLIGIASSLILLAAPKPEPAPSRAVALAAELAKPEDQIVATGAFYLPAKLAAERGQLSATLVALPRELASHPGWFEAVPLSNAEISQVSWSSGKAPTGRLFLLHPFQYTPVLAERLAELGRVRILWNTPDAMVVGVVRPDLPPRPP